MRRLSTIRSDIEHAAADLEILAASTDDTRKAANLRATAGDLLRITYRLEES